MDTCSVLLSYSFDPYSLTYAAQACAYPALGSLFMDEHWGG
jgi:hypothetical protein